MRSPPKLPPGCDPDSILLSFPVVREQAGQRLDRFLQACIPRLSRTRANAIVRNCAYRETGVRRRPSDRVRYGETVIIVRPPMNEPDVSTAFGVLYETIADAQMARFKARRGSQDEVMDRGLWRYSRHPNYFGEAVFWWGVWLASASMGGAWTVFSPLLMNWLLLKVSGVPLLEKDMERRRPAYRQYLRTTSQFLPRPPGKPRS